MKNLKEALKNLVNPVVVVGVAALLRLVPHMPNFTPIGAMALFGGSYMDKRWGLVVPFAAMLVSDFFIGFDSWTSRAGVYGSFLLIGLLGMWLKKRRSFKNLLFASVASSLLFFTITNFEVWLFSSLYPKTLEGLLSCFTLALPFFRGTFLGDLFYNTIFFTTFEIALILANKKPSTIKV